MRITKISVKGLFGMFDHEIPLNQESRITIVHGPNGVGKTVLLQLVYGLFNYDYEFLAKTQFDQLHIEFSDNEFIIVKKNKKENDSDKVPTLEIDYEDGTGRAYKPFKPWISKEESLNELVQELLPDTDYVSMPFERIRSYWVVSRDIGSEVLSKEDILREYPELQTKLYGELPDWFARILNNVNSTFISTLRLKSEKMELEVFMGIHWRKRDDNVFPSPRDTVSSMSHELSYLGRELIREKPRLNEHLKKIDDLSAKLDRLNIKVAEFEGALAQDEISNSPYISSLLGKHLVDFVDDREFLRSDLQEAIELRNSVLAPEMFLDIINERFLFKSLRNEDVSIADKDYEIMFIADDGSEIPLTGLSSGEQQLLVLYFQLLFEIEPDTLVMIDEPELSMNVVWQRNFIKDLQRIIELRNFDVLIATHSPEVIYDKWDWTVALGEKVDD